MKLNDLLSVCYMRTHLVIEDGEGTALTDENTDIDDYFACAKYRYLDEKIVDYIELKEHEMSYIPIMIVTVR